MYGSEEIKKFEGPTFLIEGVGRERLDKTKHQSYSITYMTDFSLSYKNYIDEVDRVIFPSKYIAEHYEKDNSKNLYLGSPKYDIELDGTLAMLSSLLQKLGTYRPPALVLYCKLYKNVASTRW